MAGVSAERIEFNLGPDSCVATLYLGGNIVLEVTAKRASGGWSSATEGLFTATVLVADAMKQIAEELGLPIGTESPEAKA